MWPFCVFDFDTPVLKEHEETVCWSTIVSRLSSVVLQVFPVGLLVPWRTACFKEKISMLAALWSINAMMAFTCWETPKCIAATAASGEEIHLPV